MTETPTKISDEARELARALAKNLSDVIGGYEHADDPAAIIQRALDARPQPATQWQLIGTNPTRWMSIHHLPNTIAPTSDSNVTSVSLNQQAAPANASRDAQDGGFQSDQPNQSPRSAPSEAKIITCEKCGNQYGAKGVHRCAKDVETPKMGWWFDEIDQLRADSAEQEKTIARLREALQECARVINEDANGAIWDTIWQGPSTTLIEYIEHALADTAQKVAK